MSRFLQISLWILLIIGLLSFGMPVFHIAFGVIGVVFRILGFLILIGLVIVFLIYWFLRRKIRQTMGSQGSQNYAYYEFHQQNKAQDISNNDFGHPGVKDVTPDDK
ncbi:hypothetical protein G7084_00535 [Weissella coleopterorum]|uniref:Uncharacterized protein n=1 Tax=Weissella coleopterorum TaxID=2714949 RepID=A0A6G8AYB2_9LACO|nr:hypothetical protein [Weissella coleopterorum]QIL49942.1 hypothetical protein G7084_00535 [Weissella coleopterorum]